MVFSIKAHPGGALVLALPVARDDAALLDGLRRGEPAALDTLCRRYSSHVQRVLARILGAHPDLADLHHDTLLRVVRSVRHVERSDALKGWITITAVNVARSALERRRRRSWLVFLPSDELPDVEAPASDEGTLALRRTYTLLDRLAPDERIVFALRFIEGMELTEVAVACGTSLATVKRRLARAEGRFLAMARRDPILAARIEGGSRWPSR